MDSERAEVVWTDFAISQLDDIYNFIAQESEETALQIIDKLISRTSQISSFPMSGRKVPEFDREQVHEIIEGNYRIFYHIKPARIDVISVIHGL